MQFNKKDQSRYSFALIFSLALHLMSFGYLYKTFQASKDTKIIQSQKILASANSIKLDTVKFITHEQLQAIKNNHNKQIVANELRGKKEAPKESRFVGEADQSFDRQTMAATNGAFKSAGLGNRNGQKGEQVVSSDTSPKKNGSKKLSSKTLSLSDLGEIKISKVEDEEKINAEALEDMNKKLQAHSKKSAALGINNGSAETTGLASNNDFVEDIPLGDMSNLNTTEFKYYGFYHRIRQKLEQYWGSSIQSKAKNLYKAGRRPASGENLITAITVVLDDRGNIMDITIDGTSGVRELDQAAIESFNKAGPFPNPPKGMLSGGRAIIQWGFVVKS